MVKTLLVPFLVWHIRDFLNFLNYAITFLLIKIYKFSYYIS